MRFKHLFMAAALFVAGGTNLWAQSEPTQDGEGYYLLGTADDVEWFASQVNGGRTNLNAKLTELEADEIDEPPVDEKDGFFFNSTVMEYRECADDLRVPSAR